MEEYKDVFVVDATHSNIGIGNNMIPNKSLDITTVPNNDIVFKNSGIEVIFTWEGGKLDVIYDPDKCTDSAKAFFGWLKKVQNMGEKNGD